jgi:hypothetical protein
MHDYYIILRFLASQTNSEKCTYVSSGFGNLKTAADPVSEDFEKYLLMSLVLELNSLFRVGLATEFICDCYTDSEVFDENLMDRTALILVGVSHLRNIGRFVSQKAWKVFDLTTPGWRTPTPMSRKKLIK